MVVIIPPRRLLADMYAKTVRQTRMKDIYIDAPKTAITQKNAVEEYKKDREELEALLIPEPNNKIAKIDLNSLHNYSTAEFRDGYKQLTISEKSSLWRQVIKNIVVYPDGNLKINFLGY